MSEYSLGSWSKTTVDAKSENLMGFELTVTYRNIANVENVKTNETNEIPHPMYVIKRRADFASESVDSSLSRFSKIAKCVK